MRKLKFKITTYEYVGYKILEKTNFYEAGYEDNIRLIDILEQLRIKFDKKSDYCRAIILDFSSILWGKYFKKIDSENNMLLDERRFEDYYKYKIGDLCSQFDIEEKELEILFNPPIGGDVGRHRGIHYFFHTAEKDIHHRPHIHIKSGDTEFRVTLDSIEILDKNTFKSPKKTKLAIELVKLNQEELLNYWNKVVINGESIKYKMYFPTS